MKRYGLRANSRQSRLRELGRWTGADAGEDSPRFRVALMPFAPFAPFVTRPVPGSPAVIFVDFPVRARTRLSATLNFLNFGARPATIPGPRSAIHSLRPAL